MLPNRFLTTLLLWTTFFLATASLKLAAGPLTPDVRASSSANGQFLVLVEHEYDNPDPHAVRRILRTTYRVMESVPFLNNQDRLNTPAHFWSEYSPSWEVILDYKDDHVLFWPLVSNDGQSLILIGVTAAVPKITVMKLCRKVSYGGTLVRNFQITDLWTAKQIDPDGKGPLMIRENTPHWFSGGSMTFSSDNQNLIYRTQFGDQLNIHLVDGAVSRE